MDLLTALKTLRDEGPTDQGMGICGHVKQRRIMDPTPLPALMRSWPECSGSADFPVPSFGGSSPRDAYLHTRDLWVGEYGAARRRLLDYMIEKLEDESCE